MPSRTQNTGVILLSKRRTTPSSIMVKKTGYYNVWLNGRHYFFDYRQQGYINLSSLPTDTSKKKKQTIVVRRR